MFIGKRQVIGIMIFALVMMGITNTGNTAAKQTEIIIGSAGSGGTYYIIGGAIANLVSKYQQNIKCTSSSTNGSIENMRLVSQKRIDIGMTQPPLDFDAYHGRNLFADKPMKQLRFLFGGHASVGHMVVPADSPAKSIQDLKGKKVGLGAPGSAVRTPVGETLLRLGGLGLDQVQVMPLSQTEGAAALRDGSIAATVFSGGYPVSSLLDLALTKAVRILPIPLEKIQEMQKNDPIGPALVQVVIPANTYKGQEMPVSTCGFITTFIGRDDLKNEVVYDILKVLAERQAELIAIHPSGKEYSLEGLAKGCTIPPHPGAAKFFQDKGVSLKFDEKLWKK
jgi:uncharacterized protein